MDTQPQDPQDLNEDFREDEEPQDYGDESGVYSDGQVVGISEFGTDAQDYSDEPRDYDEDYDGDVQDSEYPQDYDENYNEDNQNYDGYEDEYGSYPDEQVDLASEFYEEPVVYDKSVVDFYHKKCIKYLIFPIIFSSLILLSLLFNTTFCYDSCNNTSFFVLFLILMLYMPFLAVIPIIAAFCSWKAFKYSRRPELVGDGRANKRAGLLILSIVWLAPALFALFAIVGP